MFRYFVLGFICSSYAFYQLTSFPSWEVLGISFLLLSCLIILKLMPALYKKRMPSYQLPFSEIIFHIIIGFLVGFIWVFLHSFLTNSLPTRAYFTPIEVEGKILDLPQTQSMGATQRRPRVKFLLELSSLKDTTHKNSQAWAFLPPKIKLNWYGAKSIPKTGETWRFKVKLKPRHASLNPGGFDYETYLFQKGIVARGYVLNHKGSAELLEDGGIWQYRYQLAHHLKSLFEGSDFQGVYQALIYGDKSQLSGEDWALFQKTGTIHLMVISGLHVGIVAALGFGLFALLWKVLIRFASWQWVVQTPKPIFASVGAIILATLYMTMAGFSIPTQRAWLMVMVVLLFLFIRRNFQPWSALALSAFLIVLFDPRSVLSQGFWLSFMAVALIFGILRLSKIKAAPNWQKMVAIQVALTIGLMPLLVAYYHQIAVASFLANLIAVPFVSLVALPLLFITVLLSFVSSALANVLMDLNNVLWQVLWWGLKLLEKQFDYWIIGQVSGWQILLLYGVSIAGFILWPKKRETVWQQILSKAILLAVLIFSFWAIMLLPTMTDKVPRNEVKVTVLDVGQGEAVVFETANEVVVYDTGAKWSAKLDGAKLALLPYLKSQGHTHIDLLIVSHSDMDHAGGVATLLKEMPVLKMISGQPKQLNALAHTQQFTACKSGQAWSFSGVGFEILAPRKDLPDAKKDNDTSCVLKAGNGKGAALISGDLTRGLEQLLADKIGSKLQSDLLIAGHHGSRTSTSLAWLEAVKPMEVVFSSGFANRYHFPAKTVIKRLEKQQILWRNTACRGAIQYKITQSAQVPLAFLGTYRDLHSTWYRTQCETFDDLRSKAGR
ncbi:DNA internalization-related competence protein ComEC/Rec2 [Hydrogenovibrio sp. 3SP14C1]|uniref:DNA internalization-related competence protein ComEC/Rec2 n=1 Tax=Hydrogenovibrio sp. 3SP14C1 TaxID=3038774 RepID=UPI002416A428|nr:DNA internalization-related competence protein ComEC/Rec2 [Hydrogenovibrio sp. 3SP14C1]MDG4812413.1 DNA internalization-related competence protein ComEC/Rec2 [Hydrogenovibrio sp. 3SP14C1]